MCVVSHMGDHYAKKWGDWIPPNDPYRVYPTIPLDPNKTIVTPQVSREEFDALKKQVQEMMEIMREAKRYDEKTGQPDCEVDEKMEKIRKICEIFGVDFDQYMSRT